MSKKLLILAPSVGGKSTLMRYLREHTNLKVAETDEEVMKANGNVWPDDELKNTVLVPQTTREILARPEVIYLASYIPDDLLELARSKGFKVVLLNFSIEQLTKRNKARMANEGYQDATPWLQQQLNTFQRLKARGLIDVVIEGEQPVDVLVKQIVDLTETSSG